MPLLVDLYPPSTAVYKDMGVNFYAESCSPHQLVCRAYSKETK